MDTLIIRPTNINQRALEGAAEALRNGELVITPTDTLYALVCDALNPRAIDRLCRLKAINPDRHLLSILCADLSMASEYARIDNRAYRIIKDCLPGPYTFILPAANTLPRAFKGRKQVGIRIPDNDIARQLVATLGHPLMATSINLAEEFPDDPSAVADASNPEAIALAYERRDVALALNGGYGNTLPSTIVDLTAPTPEILRQGAGDTDIF